MVARRSVAAVAALILMTMLAQPAGAAPPERIDISTAEELAFISAQLTRECGFTVTAVAAEGFILNFERERSGEGRQWVAKSIYHTRFVTVESEWGSVTAERDIGPDIVYFDRDGDLMLAQMGRSITGSGMIGRVVRNLETGKVEQRSGRTLTEDPIGDVCAALAPPSG